MIQYLSIYGVDNKLKLIKAWVLLQKENKQKIYSIIICSCKRANKKVQLGVVEYVLYKNNNMYFGFLAVFMLQFSMPHLEIVLKSTVYWVLEHGAEMMPLFAAHM